MPNVFLCPTCGAPLDPNGSIDTIRCPYCNNSVIVPTELRTPSFRTASASAPMQFDLSRVLRLQEAARLARAGQTNDAIDIFREITGVGPEEALQSVQAFQTGKPVVFSPVDISVMQKPGFQGMTLGSSDVTPTKRPGCSLASCWWILIILIIVGSVLLPFIGVGYSMLSETNGPLSGILQGVNLEGLAHTTLTAGSKGTGPGNTPETKGPLSGILQAVNLGGFAHTTLTFGAKGTGPGYFTDPRTIAVDPKTGNIFVGEYDSGRVQAFDPTGKFLFQWEVTAKPKPYMFGLSAGHNGKIYMALANSPILIFDSATGKPAGQIKYKDVTSYQSVCALPDGGLLAIANDEDLIRWDADGKVTLEIPAAVSSVTDNSELETHAAANGEGDLYVLGSFNFSVFHYSAKGKYISKFGGEGDAPENLGLGTESIAVDNKGRIFVSDSGDVKVFSPDGQYLDTVSVSNAPFQITFDDANNLYVITNKPDVEKIVLDK